jgi:hypothetical protein
MSFVVRERLMLERAGTKVYERSTNEKTAAAVFTTVRRLALSYCVDIRLCRKFIL